MLEVVNISNYDYYFIYFLSMANNYNSYIKIYINTLMIVIVTCLFIDRVLMMSFSLIGLQ